MAGGSIVLVFGTAPLGTAQPVAITAALHGVSLQLQDVTGIARAAGIAAYSMGAYANHGSVCNSHLKQQPTTWRMYAPVYGTVRNGMGQTVHYGIALLGRHPRQQIRIIFVQAAGIA
jgi:hypothetical protein